MKILLSLVVIFLTACGPNVDAKSTTTDYDVLSTETNKYVEISMQLLEAMKNKQDPKEPLAAIAGIPFDDLVTSLNTKNKKIAFWVNIYNGFVQYDLTTDPESFKDKKTFYKEERHNIAGIMMSYDDIEHGIIRNSRVKISLGYLKKWFVPSWERDLRNTEIDGRIHFMLNCGAKSCPPVAIFDDAGFDDQAKAVVSQYLKKHTSVNGDTVTTSPLTSWFRGDFGGKKGTVEFLKAHQALPDDDKKYKVEFASYDWTISVGNYSDL